MCVSQFDRSSLSGGARHTVAPIVRPELAESSPLRFGFPHASVRALPFGCLHSAPDGRRSAQRSAPPSRWPAESERDATTRSYRSVYVIPRYARYSYTASRRTIGGGFSNVFSGERKKEGMARNPLVREPSRTDCTLGGRKKIIAGRAAGRRSAGGNGAFRCVGEPARCCHPGDMHAVSADESETSGARPSASRESERFRDRGGVQPENIFGGFE